MSQRPAPPGGPHRTPATIRMTTTAVFPFDVAARDCIRSCHLSDAGTGADGIPPAVANSKRNWGRPAVTSFAHADMAAEDRAYPVRMVMARTGLAQPDAERRVTEVIAQARRAIRRARANAVILAFMGAASLLAGAAVAWFAAGFGGRHRDGEPLPAFWLNRPGVPVRGMP
jgi:hypothetical protein